MGFRAPHSDSAPTPCGHLVGFREAAAVNRLKFHVKRFGPDVDDGNRVSPVGPGVVAGGRGDLPFHVKRPDVSSSNLLLRLSEHRIRIRSRFT